jgi:GT2 family glycosyltransferase
LGFNTPDDGRFETGRPVFAGCGAALAVPKPVHGEPLLDPRYFVYYEDLDLGWRRRLAGQSCRYAPRSVVRHIHGAAAGDKSPLFWFSVERNRALTALRNADLFLAVWAGLILFAKVAQSLVRFVVGGTNPRAQWPVTRAVLLAAMSYLRWMPLVIQERYNMRAGKPD